MSWAPDDLAFVGLDEGASDGDIVTVSIQTPAGPIMIMGLVAFDGRTIQLSKVHVQSEAGPNSFGIANLRAIATFLMERTNCDDITIEGANRTTGANPGRTPRVLRFTRERRPAAG